MARTGVKAALPRLASFLTTLSIGRSSVTLPTQALAQELLTASNLKLNAVRNGQNPFGLLLQRQITNLPSGPSQQSFLLQSRFESFWPRAAASDVGAYLKFRSCQHCPSISSPAGPQHPAAYLSTRQQHISVRQQHNHASPHVTGASTAQSVKKVQSETSGKKVQNETSGGNKEGGEGGTGKGFFASLQDVPLVPLLLGFAGAIPFVALAPPVAPLLPLPEDMHKRRADWQAAYGAVIASFLGGVHWGLAMAEHGHRGTIANFSVSALRYTWGVIPALLAWPALLLPPAAKFAALSGVLGLAFLVDSGFAQLKLLPKWYMPLRISLTVLAVGGLVSSWSVAAVKSTYDRARNELVAREERPPEASVKPASKVL